jgi:hypothetical protein
MRRRGDMKTRRKTEKISSGDDPRLGFVYHSDKHP